MAIKEIIMVVGTSPLDDKFGFNAVSAMPFGTFIPAEIENTLVKSLEIDASDDNVTLTMDGTANILGASITLTLESGQAVVLIGTAGVYTFDVLDVRNTTFKNEVVSKKDGVCNMTVTYTA